MNEEASFALAAATRAARAIDFAPHVPGLLEAVTKVIKMDYADSGYRAAVAEMDALVANGLTNIRKPTPSSPQLNIVDDVMRMLTAAQRSQPNK